MYRYKDSWIDVKIDRQMDTNKSRPVTTVFGIPIQIDR